MGFSVETLKRLLRSRESFEERLINHHNSRPRSEEGIKFIIRILKQHHQNEQRIRMRMKQLRIYEEYLEKLLDELEETLKDLLDLFTQLDALWGWVP